MAKTKKIVTAASKGDEKGKEKALNEAISGIKKVFGEGSIMKMGENLNIEIEKIPTGSMTLDMALGGGIPKGRIIEIYGAESSGKTTIALHIIAEAQKQGGVVAYIDAEHALDPKYAKALGVDIDELLISQPDFGEQALEIADTLVRSEAIDVIVVDSVAALVPKNEIDGVMGDQQMGLHARLMSKALRKLTSAVSRSNTAFIFINQIREKIGGMPTFGGVTTTTTGGRALKFFASVRMEVKRGLQVKQGDNSIGCDTIVKITKNKIAPPFKEARFQIMFGKGISKVGEYMDIAEASKIIKKAGSWFNYRDIRVQGKENLRSKFEEDREVFDQLIADVEEVLKNTNSEILDKLEELESEENIEDDE